MQTWMIFGFLIVFEVAICHLHAEDAVDPAEKEYNRAVEKAKAEYDANVKVARDKFIATLKVKMETLTKKADLDGALKIREKISLLDKQTGSVQADAAIKGKFYTFVDEKGTLFINGKSVFEIPYRNGVSPEIDLHDGDIVLFDVKASKWHGLRVVFCSTDGKRSLSVIASDVADVTEITKDITAEDVEHCKKMTALPRDANAEKIWNEQGLGSIGEFFWGQNPKHCRLAFIVRAIEFKNK